MAAVAPRVLERTESFVVVDKPPDVRMDGRRCPVTMETLAGAWCGRSDVRWTHRLDYGTSGLLVGAWTKEAARNAGRAFESGAATKVYSAVAVGFIRRDDFVIDAPIAATNAFLMRVSASGKRASTRVRVVGRGRYRGHPVSVLSLSPATGRRHQLRVHLASVGHPLVGDATYYGGVLADAPRMMLHARSIDLRMPDGARIVATTPDPFRLDQHGRLRFGHVDLDHCVARVVVPPPPRTDDSC